MIYRWGYVRFTLLGLLLIVGACLGFVSSAHAATFSVTTTTVDSADINPGDGICADSNGQCSVRAALMEANELAGADVINIPAGTYTLTLGQLEIKDHVKLVGTSGNPANTYIQAANSAAAATHRVLEINPDLNAAGYDVTIQGLTIRHGKAPDDNGYGGGGIGGDVGDKTLVISNSVIEKNIASGKGFGGGMYMSGSGAGKVQLTDVVFDQNTAGESGSASYGSRGGGLYLEGDMTLEMSNIQVKNNTSYGMGGGMAILSASQASRTVTISSSTITSNKANSKIGGTEGNAGGLYLGTPAAITNTTITNNTSGGDGGGLFLNFFTGSVSLTDVEVTGNSAVSGGGMFINANKAPSLTRTSITGNTGGNVAVNTEGTDMRIAIAPNGVFSQGKTGAHYSVTVQNTGNVKTNGPVTATVTLPSGLTATGLAGTGWACTLETLTCTTSNVLNGKSSYSVIDVTVDVAANAPRTVTSTVQVSGGDELDVSNNAGSHLTTVLSSDASLQGLFLSKGVLNETFASETLVYTADVLYAVNSLRVTPIANESHATIKVNNVTVSSGQPSGLLGLLVSDSNLITVKVTAEDGITEKIYQITVSRAPQSDNANLSDLKVDGTSVADFASGTLTYEWDVPNVTTAVVVTGIAEDETAKVEVTGGSTLVVGENTVTVKVTAEDGTTVQTYTVKVVRAPSSNASLSDLKVDGTSVTGFASGTFEYTLNVANAKTAVVVSGTKADATASVMVVGGSSLIVGENTVTVTVTAEDETTVLTYTVKVVRAASSNANLSDLKVDGTSVTGFLPGTLLYTVNVPNAKTAVVVSGVVADATASVSVAGGSSLAVGNNTVTVTVTAENGTTIQTYTVKVVRAASSNASLSDLTVDGTSVTDFAPGKFEYTLNVANAKTAVVVSGVAADATASINVAGGSSLVVGENTVTVTVTAENGTTVLTYTVKVVRAASSNASLSDLKVDGTSVTGFAPGKFEYTLNVANAKTVVVVSGVAADATASVSVAGGNSLVVGENTVTVTVTAEDGTTIQTYTLKVVRAASSNASLSDLKVDGTSVTGFDSGTLTYTVNVANAKTAVAVTGTAADATASVSVAGGSSLVVGENTVTVTVTAENGTTIQTYTVKVVRAASSNASLSDLKVDGTSVTGFDSGTLTYTVNVANTKTAVVVSGVAADATASVSVAGGSSLVVGENTVTVTVTAENGTTIQTYTVKVFRAASSNASLSDLTVDGTSVTDFAPGTFEYTVNVASAKTAVVVSGVAADATASVSVAGGSSLVVGENTVTVTVTAENGTTIQTYTVKVVRAASSNASLSDLKVDGTSVTGFAPGTFEYTLNVANAKTAVVVSGVAADATASISVTGGNSLVVGENTVTVTVTAENGTTIQTYTVKVVRAASSNASLSDLKVDGTSVTGFDSGTLTYTVNVANAKTAVVVTGTAADATASVVVAGGSSLVVGENTVTVTVTAENGTTIQTYTVKVVRAASSNASLSDLKVDGTSVTGFLPGTLLYTVNVANAKTAVVVTGTAADATASVVVAGGSSLVVGENTVTVTVTAENGTTIQTYTVKVFRAASSNASLSDLKVDGTSVTGFDSGTLTYTVNVANAKTAVVVSGVAADATASVSVAGGSNLTVGENTVTVTVTAENGTTIQTYTVKVFRAASSNASLNDLKVDGTSVTDFAPGTFEYTVNVANAKTAVAVTGTAADATASVSVAGGSSLVVGENTVTVTVTAENGTTIQTYTVKVVRAASSNASLSDLKVDGTSVTGFDSDTLTYTVNVANAKTAVAVTGTAADATASVSVAGGSSLTVGENTVTVTVTAENGTTIQTYTVKVVRAASSNASLSDLKVDGTSVTGFLPGTLLYTVNVANAKTAVVVTGTAADATASVVVAGGSSLVVGENTVTVTVKAEDGTTIQTYIVKVVRAASSNASLNDLKVDGASVTDFAPGTFEYTVNVPNATTAVVVTGTAADATASVTVTGGSSLAVGENAVTVTVKAEDGTTVQTYTVKVVRAKSSDKSFNFTLNVDGTSSDIQWDTGTNSASINVTSAVYSATVTGSVYDSTTQLEINGINVASGQNITIPLEEGLNTVLIKVTAEDLSTEDYMLLITRYGNAELTGLTASGVDLTPPFNLSLLNYRADVPYTLSSTTVTASVYDPNAKVTILGLEVSAGSPSELIQLAVGENIIPVVVTPTFGLPQYYTITITRAESDDTGLSGLIVNNGNGSPIAVTLGADGKYYATVSNSNLDLIVTPQPADPGAGVQVNGLAVDQQGESSLIPLVYGTNEITIVITSQAGTAKTYHLLVTRQQPPSNPGGGGGTGVITPAKVTLSIGDSGRSIELQVQRERTPAGKVIDKIVITPDAMILLMKEAIEKKQGVIRLMLSQLPEDNDQVNVIIPANALHVLEGSGLALSIEKDKVQISLPSHTVAKAVQSKEDLEIRFVPIRKDSEKQEAQKRVLNAQIVTEAAGNGKVVIHGSPMIIEMNLKNQEARLNFSLKGIKIPADPIERSEFLSSLGVYIEHSDGEKELQKGIIKYDELNNPIGIEIVITKFSTFSMLEVQKVVVDTGKHMRWIEGYPDGTFKPTQSITRAEIASILAKAIAKPQPSNSSQRIKFKDVAENHWAADVIAQVQDAGWLGGYPDGSFKPDAPITRAELAAIIVRLKKLEVIESDQSFTDTPGHWAAGYIQAAKAAGLVDGYEDGSFRPDQKLTRAEAVKVMNTLLNRPTPELEKGVWTDVSNKDWFWLEVQSASISFNLTRYEDGSEHAVIIP
ncbi:cadherin-like beta sandwich domain-containing protein [Paenibacillus eucommiae]|uniref:SLH domain-containing protein n=1 Tax=Paenibacillus eucommiae TaxID=1355755 RepID=A0ABS4IVS4_9BACL|nr:cadherin-like beta sandwich domain-containing protein [Paenibacillus eucommiae]MBP1991618.1 hypothetical protein [Paenibacillus eucommiae]